MLALLLASIVLVAAVMVLMAVGVALGRRPLEGSCGGPGGCACRARGDDPEGCSKHGAASGPRAVPQDPAS